MDLLPLDLAGAALRAMASGALWWPATRLLCVADLHLGKSERLARRGGALLPPYETRATLDRLETAIHALGPEIVVCLGDSFDDSAAVQALERTEAARLAGLARARRWIWVAGNHDPVPPDLPGEARATLTLGPLTFRHAAEAEASPGEVSGHYHPKLHLMLKGGAISRPCFLIDGRRLILPAFGAFTGGLGADHPALRVLMGPEARAVLTGTPAVSLPLARALARTATRRATVRR